MEAEQEVFYPYLLAHGEDRVLVLHMLEEHRAAQNVLKELENTGIDDEIWLPRLMLLEEMLEHHIKREEEEAFDLAKDILDEDLSDEMTRQFEDVESSSEARSGRF